MRSFAVRAVTLLPRGLTRLRSSPPDERLSFAFLVGLTLLAVLVTQVSIEASPPSFLALPVLLGGLLLSRTRVLQLFAVAVAGFAVDAVLLGTGVVRFGGIVVVVATFLVAYESARSREVTGLGGLSGETVLVELRQRLLQQGALPALPPGWQAEAVVRPAGGGPFAGDFVVSARTGDRLEITLVDVSGKGVEAGSRALLLSGALGGLLGGGDGGDLLASGNTYLVRQDWEEGFATAVHVVLDLRSGDYQVRCAGHPPAVRRDAGTGTWHLSRAEGPALGLLPDMTYDAEPGRLDPGDALLLYTDGLVEIPGRELSVGIDKLVGAAERLVSRGGFAGGADALITAVAGDSADDRGLVLLWRHG